MGVNNRARREAKRRKRAKQRPWGGTGPTPPPGAAGAGYGRADRDDGPADRDDGRAAAFVVAAVEAIRADRSAAARFAALLTGGDSPVPPRAVATVLGPFLADLVHAVVAGGWAPSDLAQITERRAGPRHRPLLAAALTAETQRHAPATVASAWRAELLAVGPAEEADLSTATGLELALGLCAVLGGLPRIQRLVPPPGAATGPGAAGTGADGKVLARVRSLLAKAESTDFPEEAEALSAKAQELISRHALGRLAHEPAATSGGNPVTARRLWLDPPYVFAKALLVDAVAAANRCRSVVAEQLGFTTVIGDPGDVEAVEVLVTSLLVQANAAMLRHGRQADRWGASRTTSFRRAFLLAYATRIGERLQAVSRDALAETGRAGELVPVLLHRAERVEATVQEMFPAAVPREVTVSNGHGWAAGRAAADLALLDTTLAVTEAAS